MKRALLFFFKRSMPGVIPFITGVVLVLISQSPRSVVWLSIGGGGLLVAGILIMMSAHDVVWRVRMRVVSIALYFLMGAIGLQLITDDTFFRYIIIGVTVIVLSLYMESLFVLTYRPALYVKTALENVVMYPGVLGVVGVSSSLVAFSVYLSLSVVLFVPVVMLGCGMLSYHIWCTGDKKIDVAPSVLAISVFMGLLWYVLAQLPITFWVTGVIVAVWWYICTHMMRTYWHGILTVKRTIVMVGGAIAITLISLFMSRWV